MNLTLARAVADAVLYEGYLLYPYRASSRKNQMRWQFGVLGPPDAAAAGLGDESSMSTQCIFTKDTDPSEAPAEPAKFVVHLRFLQLQRRQVYDYTGHPVEELDVDRTSVMSWDEATEHELTVVLPLSDLAHGIATPLMVTGGEETETLTTSEGAEAGKVVRRRWPLYLRVSATTTTCGDYTKLEIKVDNDQAEPTADKDAAIRNSLIGAHLLIEAHGAEFVSLLEPPDDAADVVEDCHQRRCFPALAGNDGDTDLIFASPIILYDYPEIAAESAGALFDSTEIDEILTLRVMTMTDEEKAEARATDPRARQIIDRCDEMTPETLQQLHGILRDPHAGSMPVPYDGAEPQWPGVEGVPTEPRSRGISDAVELPTARNPEPLSFDNDAPWWDPVADASVEPGTDEVIIDGVPVSRGSFVRVHPKRRSDAQDLFFDNQVAKVTGVLFDVDGGVHVALLLVDDPATDLHDWYGRYFYYDPDEVEPLTDKGEPMDKREESRS